MPRHASGEESLLRQVLLMALWGIVGVIVPRATVYGSLAPFGVGAAAAVSGPGSVVVYLATGMGYLLPEGRLSRCGIWRPWRPWPGSVGRSMA